MSYTWRDSVIHGAGFQNVIAAHPSTPGILLSGGDVAGIQRTTDGGDNWVPVNTGLWTATHLKIAGFAWSAANPLHVLAGYGYQGGGGLLWSQDGGITWGVKVSGANGPQFSGSTNPKPPTPTSPGNLEHPRSTGDVLIWDESGTGVVYAGTYNTGVQRASINKSTGAGGGSGTWTTIGLAQEVTAYGTGQRTVTYYIRGMCLVGTTLYVAALATEASTNPADQYTTRIWQAGSRVYRITNAGTSPVVTRLNNSPPEPEEIIHVSGGAPAARLYVASRHLTNGGVFRADPAVTVSSDPVWDNISASPAVAADMYCTVFGYVSGTDHIVFASNVLGGAGDSTFGPSIVRSNNANGATPTWATMVASNGSNIKSTVNDAGGETWWLIPVNGWLRPGKSGYVGTKFLLNDGKLYSAGRSCVWRTANPTASPPDWYPIVRGMGVTICRVVEADPTEAGIVYVGNTDWGFFTSPDDLIVHATMVNNDPGDEEITGLTIHPVSGKVYLTGGGRDANGLGRVRSIARPGTGSWTVENPGNTPAEAYWDQPAPKTDRDATLLPMGIAVGVVGGQDVQVVAFQGDAASPPSGRMGGIYRKIGTGAWNRVVTAGAPTMAGENTDTADFSWPDGATSQLLFLYARGTGVYRSSDAGANWELLWGTPSNNDSTGFVTYDPNSHSLYISANNQLYKLSNAHTAVAPVTPTNMGLANVGPITASPSGEIFVACKAAGGGVRAKMMYSDDDGGTWTDLADDYYRSSGILPFDSISYGANNTLVLALNGGGVIVGIENVNLPPVASFTCTPLTGTTVTQFDVDATASTDDVGIVSYDWNWGDLTAHGSGVTANHTYAAPGIYTITLTVTDGGSLQDTETVNVTVEPETPPPTGAPHRRGRWWWRLFRH